MEAVPVGFGSEAYFDLLAARPEWGRYFALGSHVIVVLEGTAYEIREGDAPSVDVPDAAPEAPTVAPEAEPAGDQTLAGDDPSGFFGSLAKLLQELVDWIRDLFD